jgi:hypothetical protein
MTDRTISFLVTLDKQYRTDDAEAILNAIKMIKGVLSVDVNICDSQSNMNAFASLQQLRNKFFEKIGKVFEEM